MYRLEQPPVPDELRTRRGARMQQALPSAMGASPIQRPSPGRMLATLTRQAATDMCSIFVGGLPSYANEDCLRDMFQVYGRIVNIDLIQKSSVSNSMSSPSFRSPHCPSLMFSSETL